MKKKKKSVKVLATQAGPSFCISMTVASQSLLSMGFSRQKYWGGQPFPSPGDFPNPGIKPVSLALQVDSLLCEPLVKLENILHDYMMVDTCQYTSVQTHETHSTQSEP